MITVAKMTTGKLVEIVRVSDYVVFAPGTHVLICRDWQKPEYLKGDFKWVPIDTRFEWVREFHS